MDKRIYAAVRRAALAKIAERKATKTFTAPDELIDYIREVAVNHHEAEAEIAAGRALIDIAYANRARIDRARHMLRQLQLAGDDQLVAIINEIEALAVKIDWLDRA